MSGETKGLKHAGVRTEPGRLGFVDCLVVGGGEGGERRARRWNLLRRRRESCRDCMEVVGVGRLASLEGGCRPRCGGEGDQETACLRVGVEVGFVSVAAVAEAVAAEGSLTVCSRMESRLDQHCRSSRIVEEILGDERGLRCGKSLAVPLFVVKVVATRRMASGSATPARLARGPCCLGRSFACCRVNPGYRPVPSVLPCDEICPVAWRTHRDGRGCRDPGPG
jgi:hypothetical protein